MILKVRRFCDDQIWWILDDIRKVSISKTLEIPDGTNPEAPIDNDISLLDNFSGGDPKAHATYPYIRLICRLSNGNEFSVVFDTVAYLCNDSGKTIEKLTV